MMPKTNFQSMDLQTKILIDLLLLQKPKFVRHCHKQLVYFATKNSLVVIFYQCLCQCLDLIRDQQYNCSGAFQYPGQLLKIWDCPGDSRTVGAYEHATDIIKNQQIEHNKKIRFTCSRIFNFTQLQAKMSLSKHNSHNYATVQMV